MTTSGATSPPGLGYRRRERRGQEHPERENVRPVLSPNTGRRRSMIGWLSKRDSDNFNPVVGTSSPQ